MLRHAYLSRKLTSPLPTIDGGTLRTIGETCEYMAAIDKERELRPHWQRVRELMLQEADAAALSLSSSGWRPFEGPANASIQNDSGLSQGF
jgi:hypothetical protein